MATIPTPEAGLVISYAYLWRRERETGLEEGRKDRPSVIVLAVERQKDGATIVTVLPITTPPAARVHATLAASANGRCPAQIGEPYALG